MLIVACVSMSTDQSSARPFEPGCASVTLSFSYLHPVCLFGCLIDPNGRPLYFIRVQRSSIFSNVVSQLCLRDWASSKALDVGNSVGVVYPVTQSFVDDFFSSVRCCPEFELAQLAIRAIDQRFEIDL